MGHHQRAQRKDRCLRDVAVHPVIVGLRPEGVRVPLWSDGDNHPHRQFGEACDAAENGPDVALKTVPNVRYTSGRSSSKAVNCSEPDKSTLNGIGRIDSRRAM